MNFLPPLPALYAGFLHWPDELTLMLLFLRATLVIALVVWGGFARLFRGGHVSR